VHPGEPPLEPASLIWTGSLAGLIVGLATGLGAVPVLFLVKTVRPFTSAMMLGFGAGVMLAATSFSLIIPGIEAAGQSGYEGIAGSGIVAAGMMIGAIGLLGANRYLPHEHFIKGLEGFPTLRLSRIWLFVLAITLHNFPEGLAVGVGFGGGRVANGTSLAVGIALQNLPEGLAVALALSDVGYSRARAFLVSLMTGLAETVGAVLGVTAIAFSEALLPWGLGFAAGAMLFVISNEIIPESHREGQGLAGTAGVVVGFLLMMLLDTAFTRA
jgi:ZIP family zinc transporter